MARKSVIPLPRQSASTVNVLVKTQDTEVDWLVLEIENGDEDTMDVELKPNAVRRLTLDPGSYRFWFHFERIAGPSTVTLQVRTKSDKSPFPPEPKTRGADPGKRGQTSTQVIVT